MKGARLEALLALFDTVGMDRGLPVGTAAVTRMWVLRSW